VLIKAIKDYKHISGPNTLIRSVEIGNKHKAAFNKHFATTPSYRAALSWVESHL
jgi:hypothetical protein